MLEPLPIELSRRYENELKQRGIATQLWAPYTKWLRYDWDFCHKYDYAPNARQSFPPFAAKLRSKRQSDVQRKQAQQAILLYYSTTLLGRLIFAAELSRPEKVRCSIRTRLLRLTRMLCTRLKQSS